MTQAAKGKKQLSTRKFKAEVQKVLALVVRSLYSNKEIFLRELISNASDALEKLRFEALRDADLYENDSDLRIDVEYNRERRTISVSDNGIGMSLQEASDNLGTIAGSGTQRLLESLQAGADEGAQLIGKFGVGFYSSFIVASKVEVLSRHAGALRSEGVHWSSGGESSYSVEQVERPRRGTRVILHLRPEEDSFLDGRYLREIIRRYSDHISFPISMDAEPDRDAGGTEGDQGTQGSASGGKEVINQATAIWTRRRKDVGEQEYNEFYRHISHDPEPPLAHIHSRVEGASEYTCLLYIPSKAPWLPWERQRHSGIHLYVRRVFVMDGAEQFLPPWLRFVRGVVDADDLPLNVSREILQENRIVSSIRNGCTRKVLDRLSDLAQKEPQDYLRFWKEFGYMLREGVADPSGFRDDLIKLLRFHSTHSKQEDELVSLVDYVNRMGADQHEIYCMVAGNLGSARNSPHLEIFRERGIEVLLFGDAVDEWLLDQVAEYDGKKLRIITRGELQLPGVEPEAVPDSAEEQEWVKQVASHLGDRVASVRFSRRLRDSASCTAYGEQQLSGTLQRVLRAGGHQVPHSQPILELNPEHHLVSRLRELKDSEQLRDWSHVLLDQALLTEGSMPPDAAAFVQRLNRLLAEPPVKS